MPNIVVHETRLKNLDLAAKDMNQPARTGQPARGAYVRRMCARMDKPQESTAATHKQARLLHGMRGVS